MPHNDTLTSDINDLFLLSGQFSTTIKTSQAISVIDPDVEGISFDRTDTPWIGNTFPDKLYLQSGQFSSTLKTSLDVSGDGFNPSGISYDGTDTPWANRSAPSKLFRSSGQFTATVKSSLDVSAVDNDPRSVSWDEADSPWMGSEAEKLYLQSGHYTSTLKTSEDISGVATDATGGITWDGTNTPWSGDNPPARLYLTSGQFTSTIKTSTNIGGAGIGTTGMDTNAIELSCDVSGTMVSLDTDESDIVAGGRTIILTLNTGRLNPQSDTWHPDIGANNSRTTDLINGLTSSGAEANGWNNVVRAGLTFSDVVRTSATVVTITLPAFASYDITIDEAITATIPATALTGANGPLTAAPSFVVAREAAAANTDTIWSGATDEKLYLQSGQFTSTIKDSEDVSAVDTPGTSATTQVDAPWMGLVTDKAYLQSGLFTSTLKTSLDMTSVDSDMQGISWDNTNTPVMGNSANKMFLTSGQFTTTIKDSEGTGAFDVTPRGISWDATDTPWQGQLNTTTFGDTLYLQSGQFTSTLKTSQSVNAIDTSANDVSFSAGTGDTPWIGAAADKLYLTSGQFSSTLHDSEDISAVETAPNGIDVNDRLGAAGPVTISLIGSVVDDTEQDIRNGASVLILVLSGDTWVATMGGDNAITQALIDGLTSAQNEARGWNAIVRPGLNAANVIRTSDTIVTITLPAFTGYDLSANETITGTVPASALTTTVVPVVASPTFTITFIPIAPATPRRVFPADHAREYVTYIGPDGTRFPFNTPHQFGRWVISFSGLGTPPIDYIIQRGPFQHGATVKDFFLAPRVIQLLIRQEFCDRLDWWDGRSALLDILRPNRQTIATATQPGILEFCLPDGSIRQIESVITEGPRFEPRQLGRWDENAFQEVLRFISYNPVFFDPTRVDASFTILLDAELVFPITFPIRFGGGHLISTLNINYTGTWESFPTIVITGPLEDAVIRNLTTGEILRFNIDISPGQIVTIALPYGAKTVTDNFGANLIGNLTPESDLATFHIAPDPEAANGVNVLTLTGKQPTGATDVELQYFTRFFGI